MLRDTLKFGPGRPQSRFKLVSRANTGHNRRHRKDKTCKVLVTVRASDFVPGNMTLSFTIAGSKVSAVYRAMRRALS